VLSKLLLRDSCSVILTQKLELVRFVEQIS
jgi:hypothetical protein